MNGKTCRATFESLPLCAGDRLWQHVTSAIRDRDQMRATQEKFVLEEAQRKEARERGEKAWTPKLFHQDPVTSEWSYRHIEYVHVVTLVRDGSRDTACFGCLFVAISCNRCF